MRKALLSVLLIATGCSGGNPESYLLGNPELDLLQLGTQAIVVIDKDIPERHRPEEHNASGLDLDYAPRKAIIESDEFEPLTKYVLLSAGVRVTVGEDPGYYDRTQEEIDKDLEDMIKVKDNTRIELLKNEKPGQYYPPDVRARFRPVRVVVESGRDRGVAGVMKRKDLRPFKGD